MKIGDRVTVCGGTYVDGVGGVVVEVPGKDHPFPDYYGVRLDGNLSIWHYSLDQLRLIEGDRVDEHVDEGVDERVVELEGIIRLYDAAADKFLNKVETGRARSTETYNDLKEIRAITKKVL